jgi:hypothetical protein
LAPRAWWFAVVAEERQVFNRPFITTRLSKLTLVSVATAGRFHSNQVQCLGSTMGAMLPVVLFCLACGLDSRETASEESPTAHVAPPSVSTDGTAAFEGMMARHQEVGKTPEGAFKLWLQAIYLIQNGENPTDTEAGWLTLTALTLPFKDDPDWFRLPANQMFVQRLRSDHDVFRSYAKGAKPENGYAMDPRKFDISVTRKQQTEGEGLKMFVVSGGADNPRPVYMKKSSKTGLYYVSNPANMYVSVRAAVDPNRETFE